LILEYQGLLFIGGRKMKISDDCKLFYEEVFKGTQYFNRYDYLSNRVRFDDDSNLHQWITEYKSSNDGFIKWGMSNEVIKSVKEKLCSLGFIINDFYKQDFPRVLVENMLRMTPMTEDAKSACIKEEICYLIMNSNNSLNLLLDRVNKKIESYITYSFLDKKKETPIHINRDNYGDDVISCEENNFKEWVCAVNEMSIESRLNNSNYLIYNSALSLPRLYGDEYTDVSNLFVSKMLRPTRLLISIIASYNHYISEINELEHYSAMAFVTFYLKNNIDANDEWAYKTVINDGLSQLLNGVQDVDMIYPL